MGPARFEMPYEIVDGYYQLAGMQGRTDWRSMSENELWHELCRCILSSNVPYELALSAWSRLRDLGLIESEWMTVSTRSACYGRIAKELRRPIYLPKKKDGSYRKYRFPNVRARNIVDAALFIYSQDRDLRRLLECFPSGTEARDYLGKNLPGIGMKEASHFLRDIGYTDSLAIVDSHIISFLRKTGAIQIPCVSTLTPRLYRQFEKALQTISEDAGLNLAVLDMAIWRYMREIKGH
jgi:N-glycosylase/DNA lyase